jgi:hypothetical protein
MAVLFKTPDKLSDQNLGAFDNSYKCKTTNRNALQFAQGQALELSGINCLGGSLSVVTNYYAVGNWLYQVTAVFPPTDADSASAQRFLNSFKVVSAAQSSPAGSYYFVSNTQPPDAYLSLRTEPSTSSGQRIATMPNGTLLEVLQRRPDGWWEVRIVSTGQTGWALSGEGGRVWISCCRTN